MNKVGHYNYGPQNYSLINKAISDIQETIGDPTNPDEGTIFSELGYLNTGVEYLYENKQNTLTAGDGISITDNVISVNYAQANGVSF